MIQSPFDWAEEKYGEENVESAMNLMAWGFAIVGTVVVVGAAIVMLTLLVTAVI